MDNTVLNVKANGVWYDDVTLEENGYDTGYGIAIAKDAVSWKEYVTNESAFADAMIHSHIDCENIDTVSINFTCYSHNVVIKWIG